MPLLLCRNTLACAGDECKQVRGLSLEVLARHVMWYHERSPARCFGLAPGAMARSVRLDYLAFAKRLHPDKVGDEFKAAFQALEHAYHMLPNGCS